MAEEIRKEFTSSIYIGDYSIVKAHTSFNTIRIFHAMNQGYEIHAHEEMEIIMVLDGSIDVETEGESRRLFANDVVVINSHKYHILQGSKESEIIVLQIQKDYVNNFFSVDEIVFDNFYTENENLRLKAELIKLIIANAENPNQHNFLEKHLNAILSDLVIRTKNEVVSVSDLTTKQIVFSAIEELSFNLNIKLEELSNLYHISYSHLSREFFSEVGIHFTDYVKHLKLNLAVHRLMNTNLSLTDVAIESGFSNSQVFSRIFKETFSMTPSKFRKVHSAKIMPQDGEEFYQKLKTTLESYTFKSVEFPSKNMSYDLDLSSELFRKSNKSWGAIVDLNQLIHGEFYISEFLETLEKFNPDFLRMDFNLKGDVYWPVFDSLSEKHLIKSSFNELLSLIDRLGINLLLRIRVDKDEADLEQALLNHSTALNHLLNYASLRIGLTHLQHWSFELYMENFNMKDDMLVINRYATCMVNTVQRKLLIDDLDWGINLGVYRDFDQFGEIAATLKKCFTNNQPRFLSIEYIMNGDHAVSNDLNNGVPKDNLIKLLKDLSYEYLIDFIYQFEQSQVAANPIKEASYCLNVISGMLGLDVDFHLTSWTLEDKSGVRMGPFFNSKGIESISYYFSYFMSNLYRNIRYVEPGLVISTDFDDNYNILVFSSPNRRANQITLRELNMKYKHTIGLSLGGIEGKYKIVESKIPILTYFHYHSWLTFLDADALSCLEKKYIRNKITPEIRVSVENIETVYERKIDFTPLDFMFIELKKI